MNRATKQNPFELPEERLASTEQSGKRNFIYPADVRGPLRKYRTLFYQVLVLIFLALPWITIGDTPAILLDIPNRKFALFGLTFWGHEAPILFFVLINFLLAIGLITSLFGRVWCGWACPQTVFIDLWFRKVESFFEGSGIAQRRFNDQPLTAKKGLFKGLKWLCFLALSLIITHSFLAYFVGSDRVIEMVQSLPSQNWTAFLVICFSTGIILFDFGYFREQFCIIACPYGRFQSVVMDEDSLVVIYDNKRGEPRRKDPKQTTPAGDCINCYRCVQVCPTGVDIRRGTQMECIMCTACIDACNTVMTKVGKPEGLIRYDAETRVKKKPFRFFRPRVFVYLALLVLMISGLSYTLSHRDMVSVFAHRGTHPPYTVQDSGKVLNQFQFTFHNLYFDDIRISLESTDITRDFDIQFIAPVQEIQVPGGKSGKFLTFLQFPQTLLKEGGRSYTQTFRIQRGNTIELETVEVTLIGPRLP